MNTKTKIMTNKEIKNLIKQGGKKFTIAGVTEYRKCEITKEYGYHPKLMRVSECGEAIFELGLFSYRGMNISKLGFAYMTLFTFDMLGQKTTARVKYSDITFI